MKRLFLILLAVFSVSASASGGGISAIYIIGGDSSLTYYQNGRRYDGGDNAAAAAQRLATRCPRCEVSVFRYRARGRDQALLYRGGRVVARANFQRRHAGPDMSFEARWLSENSDGQGRPQSVLYFGHWIPDFQMPYFSSTGAQYSLSRFISGVSRFLALGEKFQLVVLSTCDNGSPYAAKELSGIAEVLVAAPTKLHLSMLRTDDVILLAESWSPLDTAKKIVDTSFAAIDSFDSTEVGIAAYDLEEIPGSLDTIVRYLNSYESSDVGLRSVDCADLGYALPRPYLRFRAHRFLRQRATHSGWACLTDALSR
jgi:hypothetical protein